MAISGVEPSNIKRSSSPTLLIDNLRSRGRAHHIRASPERQKRQDPIMPSSAQNRFLTKSAPVLESSPQKELSVYNQTRVAFTERASRSANRTRDTLSVNPQGLPRLGSFGLGPHTKPNSPERTPRKKKSLFRKAMDSNLPSTGRQTTAKLRNFPLSTLFRSRRTAGVRLRTLRSALGCLEGKLTRLATVFLGVAER